MNYKIITGNLKDFEERLNQAMSQKYEIVGNLTTVHTNTGVVYSILVSK